MCRDKRKLNSKTQKFYKFQTNDAQEEQHKKNVCVLRILNPRNQYFMNLAVNCLSEVNGMVDCDGIQLV